MCGTVSKEEYVTVSVSVCNTFNKKKVLKKKSLPVSYQNIN